MTVKQKITDYALSRFLSEGFYKTSMDELASGLKMSKKTIYKHFSSKDELVLEVFARLRVKITGSFAEFGENKDFDAIKKITGWVEFFSKVIFSVSTAWLEDLRDHMPEMWKAIEEFRVKFINENLSKIIEQGKKEKYFVDIPTPVIIEMVVASITAVVNPAFILKNKLNFQQAVGMTCSVLINGILTGKGKIHFDAIMKERK